MAISIPMDLSDASERSGYVEMEPGIYAGATTAVEAHKESSIKFTVDCGEAGTTEIYLGRDTSKQGNRNSWFAMLASHGKNMEKIKAAKGAFSFMDSMVLGEGKNKCFILVTKVEGIDDQGRPKLNDKTFISKERYEALKAATSPAKAKPAAAAAAPAAAAAAPAGTPAANLFD